MSGEVKVRIALFEGIDVEFSDENLKKIVDKIKETVFSDLLELLPKLDNEFRVFFEKILEEKNKKNEDEFSKRAREEMEKKALINFWIE